MRQTMFRSWADTAPVVQASAGMEAVCPCRDDPARPSPTGPGNRQKLSRGRSVGTGSPVVSQMRVES